MLTANRDYFCTHNCYIIVLQQSCQIILPRTYITAVNDGVLRALIDKIKCRDDVFYALIHLGYVAYDIQHVRLYIPNKEVMGQIIAAIEGSNLDTIKESLKLSEQALDAVLNLDEEKVAEIVEKNHQDLTSAFSYDYEKSLSYVVHSTFVASYDRYFNTETLNFT